MSYGMGGCEPRRIFLLWMKIRRGAAGNTVLLPPITSERLARNGKTTLRGGIILYAMMRSGFDPH
ncbi:hypothetical protein BSZ15_31265 [Bradyrhizobium canariense]|nr:hypothetical protein BSZ15_31265 [Bradyrhizobium canariense]